MTLPVSRIQERELTVTGTFRYAHTWPAAIALAASRPGPARPAGHRPLRPRPGRARPSPSAAPTRTPSSPSSGRPREHRRRTPPGGALLARADRLFRRARGARHLRSARRRQVDAGRAAGRRPSAPAAVVVPMDGFHLHDDELARLGLARPQGRARDLRRGRVRRAAAPAAHRDRPRRLRPGVRPLARGVGRRRDRRPPRAPAGRHRGQLPAARRPGWRDVRPLLDEAWFVEGDERRGCARLVQRHVEHGKPPDVARTLGDRVSTRPTPTSSPGPAPAADLLVGHRLSHRPDRARAEGTMTQLTSSAPSPTSATGVAVPAYDRPPGDDRHRALRGRRLPPRAPGDVRRRADERRPGPGLGHQRGRPAPRRPPDARRAARRRTASTRWWSRTPTAPCTRG